jgi:hypothetical protein
MSGLLGRSRKRVTICLTLLVVGGIACVAVDRRWAARDNAQSADQSDPNGLSADLSAYDTVALRFPAELPDETGSLSVIRPTRGLDGQSFHLFDPNPLTAVPSAARTEPQHTPSRDVVPPPSAEIRMASAAPAVPAAKPAPRPTGRPATVLNDAQIATIKKRLKLTPDQQQMWPAVEVALRNMTYSKKPQRGGPAPQPQPQLASIDPEGEDVQNLKSAAVPLLMSFSSEQKREVRSIVQVIGLEKLASQL